MKKYLSPLKLKDCLTLVGLIAVGFGWVLIDQIFLPEVYQRIIAFIILVIVLYYLQFAINKPIQVMNYANSIAIITVSFALIVSLIMHVIIHHDFTYKAILIWIISGTLPYISGFLFMRTRKN
jgi:hypothetical protein